MTKNILPAVGILFLSATAVMAASAQRWIHVRVESVKGVSANVSFNVPIQMAEAVLPSVPADQHHRKFNLQASVNGMDLRAVLEAVRQKKTTQDIGGALGTREAGEWVAERVNS